MTQLDEKELLKGFCEEMEVDDAKCLEGVFAF